MKRILIVWMLVLYVTAAAMIPAMAEEESSAAQSDPAAETTIDPAAVEKMARLMEVWKMPVTVNEELPDGLPEDDTLCLVGLGLQLNPDGTMQAELVARLKVLLAAAQKYPQTIIICTGGPTASENPKATEAGRMAEWLKKKGLDPSRVIIENRAMTTVENAGYVFDILTEQYPQVKQIALISSDYHIPAATRLFIETAIYRDSDIEIVSNAACPVF